MLRFLFFLPALVIAKCPLNWVQYENQCYFYSPIISSWKAAEEICQVRGGHLASIHSKAQNHFLVNNVINGGISNTTDWPYAYIGGFWNAAVRKWQWTDGTPMNFTHFDTIVVPVISPTDTDPYSIRLQTNTYWTSMENINSYSEGFICQVPACDSNGRSATSILSTKGVGLSLFYLSSSNSWFYGCPSCFGATYTNQIAEQLCHTIGAHLPSIHNAFQNTDLLNAIHQMNEQEYQQASYSYFQFGLLTNATGQDWHYYDGTLLDYTNWDRNQPKKFSHTAYSYISAYDGTWSSEYNNDYDRHYGCQMKLDDNLCE